LVAGATHALGPAWSRVEASVSALRGHALDVALAEGVVGAVKDAFDPLRKEVETMAEEGWAKSAARFSDRILQHVQALRSAASTLFEVHLPEPALPTVAQQREQFSYLFLQVESPGSSVARTLRTIMPTRHARRSMLERARRHLASELDKHSGRARFDVVQRLDTVSRRFVTAMAEELEETETSILAAATSAQRALESTESRQAARDVERSLALTVAAEAEQVLDQARNETQ
ncbi:MAG: hypothetical protein ACRDV8_00065, partial [Acidimicrobiales bacterium]